MELDPTWKPVGQAPEAPAFAASSGPAAAPGKPFPTNIGQGRKVLIVDDNAVVVKGFEFKLKSVGFEVHSATEGSEAVKLARKIIPDLVLVDINFPASEGMFWDGFIIVAWLHRLEGMEQAPVIVISSSEAAKYKQKAIEAGAIDFFQKPVNFPALLTRIQEIFGLAGQTPGA